MKIRRCFVSNSSSSSFICEVCRECEAGFVTLADTCMVECERAHICCSSHIDGLTSWLEEFDTRLKEELEAAKEEKRPPTMSLYDRSYIPAELCPVCMLLVLSLDDELSYYRMRFNMSPEDILEDIIETFGSYREFRTALNDAASTRRKRREE